MSPKESPQLLHPETLGLAPDVNSDLQPALGGRAVLQAWDLDTSGKISGLGVMSVAEPSLVGASELNGSSKGLSPIRVEIAYI